MSCQALVEHIVKSIVSVQDQVKVREVVEAEQVTYFIEVANEDIGKIIGKSGKVISAVRYLISAVASKDRLKAYVKVVTENDGATA